jgi:hypothetical protein
MKTFSSQLAKCSICLNIGILSLIAGCGTGPGSAQESAPLQSNGERAAVARTFAPGAALRAPNDPPPRPTTKDACDACQGLWAVHGIEPAESCICKTSDQGQDCIDGKDCQGECILDGDAEFHVMDARDPTRGYYRGQCAPYDTTFGCFRHIADGVGQQLPLPADDASEFICVD